MENNKLVKHYELKLEKVIKHWGNSNSCSKESYIEFARKELEEVKNGRNW